MYNLRAGLFDKRMTFTHRKSSKPTVLAFTSNYHIGINNQAEISICKKHNSFFPVPHMTEKMLPDKQSFHFPGLCWQKNVVLLLCCFGNREKKSELRNHMAPLFSL
jgi:hypothetical protein